jgi:hypothetical protein
MLERIALGLTVLVLLTGPLKAMDCPVETRVEGTLDAKADAIRHAPTCKRAYAIMQACAYTASGDVALGTALRENCEPLFLTKLSKAQRRAYDRGQKRCGDKYAHEDGTMYRSFSAFCRAESTVAHAVKYGVAKAK